MPLPAHTPANSAPRAGNRVSVVGGLLILLIGIFQALGFCSPMELSLVHTLRHVTPALLPEPPRVVLLSLEGSARGFDSMDAALALRGLGQLHPRSVLLDGSIQPEEGAVRFLPDILVRLNQSGIALILPLSPSPSSVYQHVPLIRYSPWATVGNWPKIDGEAVPGSGGFFLPEPGGLKNKLPLLGTTSHESAIGSLWWGALPAPARQTALLLFGRILFLGNHTPLRMTSAGEFIPEVSGSSREMALDDFLLRMEQREQGTLSPAFDSLWNGATVVMGPHDDLAGASALAALFEEISWRHLSVRTQMFLTLGWIALFLLGVNCRWRLGMNIRLLAPLLILLLLLTTAVTLLHFGVITPLAPGLFTLLLLLVLLTCFK